MGLAKNETIYGGTLYRFEHLQRH